MGKKAYGVSAGAAEIHFTVRSDSNEKMRLKKSRKGSYFDAEQFHLNAVSWTQKFYANENNQQQSNIF
jgi:hypothetical protein